MKKIAQRVLCILIASLIICVGNIGIISAENVDVIENEFATAEASIKNNKKAIAKDLNNSYLSTETESVEINTVEELIEYRDNINNGIIQNAVLTSDIDLNGCDWEPIGATAENPFSAIFNGADYSILNLNISTDSDNLQGMFGYVSQDGVIRNLTVTGSIEATNAGGIAGQLDGNVENCTSYVNIAAEVFAGGIAAVGNGTITDCTNNGVITVTGSETGAAGGIVATSVSAIANCANNGYVSIQTGTAGGVAGYIAENSPVTNCVNTASVHGDISVGGIAGSTKGTVSACRNTGEIYASGSLAGGIVGKAENTIENSINTGVLTGKTYIGGIVGRTSSNLTNVRNYGQIYATASYAGGIVGYVSGGSTSENIVFDKCVNYGEIYVNDLSAGIVGAAVAYIKIENAYNYGNISAKSDNIGGIIGYTSNWGYTGEYSLNKTANFGAVKSYGSSIGGIAGRMLVGQIENSFNAASVSGSASYGGIIGIGGNRISIKNSFDYSSTGKSFSYCTVENVYKLSSNDSEQNRTAASFSNGSVLELLNDTTVWKQGGKYPVFIDDVTETGVKTEAQLVEALNDSSVYEIVLAGDIDIVAPLEITRNVKINGKNHRINGKGSVFVINDAEVELCDISLTGSQALIISENSEIQLSGNVVLYNYLSTGIISNNSVVTINESVAFTAMPQQTTIYSDKTQNIQRVCDIEESDGNYLYCLTNSNVKYCKTNSIVVKAENNEGISYDVFSVNKDFDVYLMLPSSALLESVTYTEIDANGKEYNTYTKDFTDSSFSVQMGYKEFNLQAMQSSLPTLYIEIDETYGTIDAMHSDPEHDTKAYGQVQIDVPDPLVEKYGWDKTYKSKEGDSEKPCTMEIKGRGNSTWNTTPGVKKPYQIKSEKKVDFLGMGKAKTWCLLKSGEKQKFGLDLGLAIGLSSTPDSRFVDVYMNGEYYGYYAMTEKVEIKDERVEITDLEDEVDENGITANTDLTGGYLLEIDNYPTDPIHLSTNGNAITVKSPENLDEYASKTNNYSYIYNHIDEIFNAIYGVGKMEDGSSYMDHIDVESFVRYYWHQEFIANFDCGIGSTYMYKDSDRVDHKLYAGPIWDSDNLLKVKEGWYVKNRLRNEGGDTLYKQLMERKEFVSYVIWYYENGIRDVLSSAIDIAQEYQTYLPVARQMNQITWGTPEYGGGSEMVNGLTTRLAWIDAHYTELMDETVTGNEVNVQGVLDNLTPYTISEVTTKSNEVEDAPLMPVLDVNVKLTVATNRDISDKLIVVCYDNKGKMIATNNIDLKIPSKTPLWKTVPVSVKESDIKTIKVFIWKDFTNFAPLCDLKEIMY